MVESKFQFEIPKIVKSNFSLNFDGIFNSNLENFSIEPKFEVEIIRDKEDTKQRSSVVKLGIIVDGEAPFTLNMEIFAMFKWFADYEEEDLEHLLNINAPSLLLSYARPVIASITKESGLDAYNIPFYDFRE